MLFGAFVALALVGFFRKSVRLKYVTLAASVLYLGVCRRPADLRSSTSSACSRWNLPIFRYSLVWYLLRRLHGRLDRAVGRLYCGRICAFGALTQLMDTVRPGQAAPRAAAVARAARRLREVRAARRGRSSISW